MVTKFLQNQLKVILKPLKFQILSKTSIRRLLSAFQILICTIEAHKLYRLSFELCMAVTQLPRQEF